MYFPYLRGKQFELIALRELAERIGESKVIHPVIEPVKETTNTLEITIDELINKQAAFTLILNPTVGEFSQNSGKLIDVANKKISEFEHSNIGLIIHGSSDLDNIDLLKSGLNIELNSTLIHKGRYPQVEELLSFANQLNIGYNLFPDAFPIRRYRNIIEPGTKVLLSDNFNIQRVNADYAEIDDEFFTDEHLYYADEGFAGFSDYLTIGDEYTSSGFAPFTVAIHLTYVKNDQIWVKHFVSDSNDDTSDVAGKYGEALEKLIAFINEQQLNTEACQEFRNHYESGHYPGLGSVKKLSVKHHMELVMQLLNG